MVRLTLPEGRQVREERGRSRGLAAERVGADGSGSQSSRRSCGAPGTSGQCQERGLDSAGGRSIHPPPYSNRPVASLGQGMEPFPTVFLEGDFG